MYLKTLGRIYLFNKAIYKSSLPIQYFTLLFTIYLIQPAGISQIIKTMARVKHQVNGNRLMIYISYLLNNNYISKDENKIYTLTPHGLATLKEIETRLRKERHDK